MKLTIANITIEEEEIEIPEFCPQCHVDMHGPNALLHWEYQDQKRHMTLTRQGDAGCDGEVHRFQIDAVESLHQQAIGLVARTGDHRGDSEVVLPAGGGPPGEGLIGGDGVGQEAHRGPPQAHPQMLSDLFLISDRCEGERRVSGW